MPDRQFPTGFAWGAATASYQIEGATSEGGRGASVWDTFCRTPGKVVDAENGDIACDHYHRYEQDADLIAELEIPNYRLSVAWPRIQPTGVGAMNTEGIDFYKRLLDSLLARKIKPCITLFHWDYPQALEDRGGWSHPDAHKWFGDYAEIVFRELGDRCQTWITLNEPWCHAFLGHGIGIHAPGNRSATAPYSVGHGLLLGHGEVVARFRALGLPGEIGITTNHHYGIPASDSPEDRKAAEQFNHWNVGWFLDPIYKGDYPEYLKSRYEMPEFTADTSQLVSQPTDFMGLNFYEGQLIKWKEGAPNDCEQIAVRLDNTTQMNWNRVPETLTQTLIDSYAMYQPKKIYVTENGCAYDYPVVDGRVHDEKRVIFLRDYICGVHDAIKAGVPVEGYYAWSLMDNFEWAEGYRPRFGIVHVDYATQKRLPKDSALMYREIIRNNGV